MRPPAEITDLSRAFSSHAGKLGPPAAGKLNAAASSGFPASKIPSIPNTPGLAGDET
jgi:hypothetical protein